MEETVSTIHLLADDVVNRIAAGEVVERPASVVKELVENSLDAGADFIEISMNEGGVARISVEDNGSGIAPGDVPLALMRHATSKINTADDIYSINSYGFRGEALASIASVSKLRITSSTGKMDPFFMEFEGGTHTQTGMAARNRGTGIECRDLFFNMPARLKFLKTPQTENSHVQDTVLRFALARHDVHFRFVLDSRIVLDFPKDTDRFQRIKTVLARRGRGSLLTEPASHELSVDGTYVYAICAPPDVSLRDSGGLYIFVNGRPIRDRVLMKAITGGYGSLLDHGRYPLCVVFITLPPQDLDVNVHPQKTEVRFKNERIVTGTVRRCITDCVTSVKLKLTEGSPVYEIEETGGNPQNTVMERIAKTLSEARDKQLSGGFSSGKPKSFSPGQTSGSFTYKLNSSEGSSTGPSQSPVSSKLPEVKFSEYKGEPVPLLFETERDYFSDFRYLGCHGGLFLLYSSRGKLLVMDMHAAHERIRYNDLMTQWNSRKMVATQLLLPHKMTVSPEQIEIIEKTKDELLQLGMEIEIFGTDVIILRSYPAVLNDPKLDDLIHDVISELETGGTGSEMGSRIPSIIATMACHSARRKGDTITHQEAMILLKRIQEVETGGFCPHGRPVSYFISDAELETRFKRR
ncbi:DNA mismatch repair endonuclease MutL [Myxococcota bacterium]|nr:DNA mismatch repair endonuclease MutL [Myxococcota bacterium]MBU1380731.1 DNA mismatch repair endonuclease MutL [Myxococcota bacterium]MBU1498041.1 DNA mismatch repair endonuclease MutL [Myxococcota bacterium]